MMRTFFGAMLALAFALLSGCGSTQMGRARAALSVSGQTVVGVERVFRPHYEAAAERAREESGPYAEYAEAMRRWFAAATAVEHAASSLELAEASLDAIERGAEGDVGGVLACVSVSLVQLLDALAPVIRVPSELVAAIRFVGNVAGDRCTPIERPEVPPVRSELVRSP
jgi:hypothetical protein